MLCIARYQGLLLPYSKEYTVVLAHRSVAQNGAQKETLIYVWLTGFY